MLHTKIKDLKHRKKYHKFEKKHLIDTFLFKNIMSKIHSQNVNSSLKKKIIFKCFKKKHLRIKNRNTRRCVYTNRSRGVLRSFKMSRLVLRELMSFGIVPGYKKAAW